MEHRNFNVPVQTPLGLRWVKVGPVLDRRDAAKHALTAYGAGAKVDINAIKRIDPVHAGQEQVPAAETAEADVEFADFPAADPKKKPEAKDAQ